MGEKLFRTWEIPRSGSKAEDGEKKERKKERAKVGDNNGQATHGARKHAWRTRAAWAKSTTFVIDQFQPEEYNVETNNNFEALREPKIKASGINQNTVDKYVKVVKK